MTTGIGGVPCRNCGQQNTGDGQFCVRCGERLPEPGGTPPPGASEHPWEPPAEWISDPQWENSQGGGAQSWDEQSRTWGSGAQGSGTQGSGTQGSGTQGSGAQGIGAPTGGAYTPPPGYQQQGGLGQPPGYQQQGGFGQQSAFQQQGGPQGTQQLGGYPQQGTPPPGYPGPGNGMGTVGNPPSRRSRTPLIAGLGALVVVALVVLGIVLFAGGGDDGPSGPDTPAVALNGEETKTPQQVLDDARVNLRTTSGVHAAGNVTDNGQSIRLDLDFAGNAAKGVLTLGGNDVQIIKIGNDVYLKGDRDFYLSVAKGDVAAVDAIGTKWLKAGDKDAKDFNGFSLDGFADVFKVNDGDSKLNPTVGREPFNGQPAVVLTQADGSRLLVANTGKAYPLRIENKNSAEAGQIDFTAYDQPVQISPPPSGDVLDLGKAG